jgi:hypothetical protein
VQSIFLKETRGKETSACPGGGQQVAENGGNVLFPPHAILADNDCTFPYGDIELFEVAKVVDLYS